MRRRCDICLFAWKMNSSSQQSQEDALQGSHRYPKGWPTGAKGNQRQPKVDTKVAKSTQDDQRDPKGWAKAPKGTAEKPKLGGALKGFCLT